MPHWSLRLDIDIRSRLASPAWSLALVLVALAASVFVIEAVVGVLAA